MSRTLPICPLPRRGYQLRRAPEPLLVTFPGQGLEEQDGGLCSPPFFTKTRRKRWGQETAGCTSLRIHGAQAVLTAQPRQHHLLRELGQQARPRAGHLTSTPAPGLLLASGGLRPQSLSGLISQRLHCILRLQRSADRIGMESWLLKSTCNDLFSSKRTG